MRLSLPILVVALMAALPGPSAWAAHNPADFPLRVHVFQVNNHSHYHHEMLDSVDGEGRANLYENSQPAAFDFAFRCDDRVQTSAGFETYLARWKKPGREIELLLPVMGKPDAGRTCSLKVELKQAAAYARSQGGIVELPAAEFKSWMDKRGYDPEHGRSVPQPPPSASAEPLAAPAADRSGFAPAH